MINNFVEKYINWLSHDITFMNKGDDGLFTTPFLNPINDCNQVKITYTEDNRIRISDNADTYTTIMQEFKINFTNSPNKKALLESLMAMYNIRLEGSELVKYCIEDTFPWALHYFSIGIMAIQNNFSNAKVQNCKMSSTYIDSNKIALYDYVESRFKNQKITYRTSIKRIGVSGFNHKFDFAFGDNFSVPAILMKTPNVLRQDNTQLMLFEWDDYLKTTREEKPRLFIVANDSIQKVDTKIIRLIRNWKNTSYCPVSEESNWMEECKRA
ncbi:MAG: DUF1829 domain-containing protein [Sphaerochaeta sp.]